MTGNKCLLDTSIIIQSFKKDNNISVQLDSLAEVLIPATAVGELFYGAYKSADPQKHLTQIESFLGNCKILPSDKDTAGIYGNVKALLAKKGKPIPENDIWIASIAIQYDLVLFTSDGHFKYIDNLRLFE